MRCQTVTNYSLRADPKWVALVQAHDEEPDSIYRVEHLTDRMFEHGFRIVNPEYNASSRSVEIDTTKLMEIINEWDSFDKSEFHNYKKNSGMSPKERAIWRDQTDQTR